MKTGLLSQLVATFGILSLLSIGGANATLPEIHRQIVSQLHWMDDTTFASLVAIGQTAPGPNVLIVSLIGWHMAGLAGLLVATAAIVVPSSVLALGLGRFMTRYEANRWIGLTRRALAPVAIGLMLASGFVMTKASFQGLLTITITVVMSAVVVLTRVSPLWGLVCAAILGILAGRLHGLA